MSRDGTVVTKTTIQTRTALAGTNKPTMQATPTTKVYVALLVRNSNEVLMMLI